MNNLLDPNAPQVNQDQEAVKEQATEQVTEPTAGEAIEATNESEEGGVQG